MTRSEFTAEHLATLRASVAGGEEDHAHIAFKRVVYAALATPGCEAQGVRLVDLPHLAERVAEMADAHERVVGERDAARTLLNLVSEALSGGEAPVDRLPELVFAMGQRFAAAVDARDAARAEVDAARAHVIALEQQNVALLRWQSVAADAHVDHLCAIVRSLAVSDETPRVLRDLSAMGVEEEIRRAIAAERINRAKSEATAVAERNRAENAEAEVAALRAQVAEAADAARRAERDRCADLVNGWHISKGGYTELAHVLRQGPE